MLRLDQKRLQVLDALADTARFARQGGLTVEQVMTRQPTCVDPARSALELVRLFQTNGHRHLLVVDKGHLVGVISDRDVLPCFEPSRWQHEQTLARVTVRELMSTDLLTVKPSMRLDDAVSWMIEHGVSCLPVLSADHLVGILTNTDVQVVTHLLLQSLRKTRSEESGQTVVANSCNPCSPT